MRKFLITTAALIAVAPVAAQPPAYDEGWDEPEVAVTVDPADIGHMAQAMDRLLGAVMDLPIGGIAAALDPLGRGGVYPGDTVRDLATRDDPAAEARIRAGIRGAARGVGAMSEAFARMLPMLQRSFEEMSVSLREAIEEVEDGDDY